MINCLFVKVSERCDKLNGSGSSYWQKVLAQLPFTAEQKDFETYSSDKVAIFKAKVIYTKDFCMKDYMFVIPISQFPVIQVERKNFMLENNKVFPVNPEQVHNSTARQATSYIVAYINKEFMHDMARSIYGKPDVYFQNGNMNLDPGMRNLIYMFMEESKNKQPGHEFMLEGLNTMFALSCLRHVDNNFTGKDAGIVYSEKKSVNKAIDYIRENYRADFSLAELAREANLSPYHFIRTFKAETGKTPFAYLLDMKMEKAKEMLRFQNHTISEICYLSGFNNLSHFTSVFKRKVGLAPSAYRKCFNKGKTGFEH